MHRSPINDIAPTQGISVSRAHTRAISRFWVDILVTLAILAVIASRF